MNERLQMKGMLGDKRAERKKAKDLAVGLVVSLRRELPSYVEIEELDLDRAEAYFSDLKTQWSAIRKLNEEIARLEKDLYE
jgi:hypothetical protein